MRNIDDILNFRADISPFLVHLTRDQNGQNARSVLEEIIQQRRLVSGTTSVSDARFGINTMDMSPQDKARLFAAICFTETPLSEVHSLLNISYRNINLAPYGLVFLKSALATRGVSPVLYLNNIPGDKDQAVQNLVMAFHAQPGAEKILPLISIFGLKLMAPGVHVRPPGDVNFTWEREWRYPSTYGALGFTDQDVFVGLCSDQDIPHFEALFPNIGFIDPVRNMKWYASKLIAARQRLNLKASVV
jgi:hypothetical protein